MRLPALILLLALPLAAQMTVVGESSGGGGGGAPTTAQYWLGAADGTLSAEIVVDDIAALEAAIGSYDFSDASNLTGDIAAARMSTNVASALSGTSPSVSDLTAETITGASGFYQDLPEITPSGNPASNVARLYSADDGGTTKLYFRDSGGIDTELGSGGSGGSGSELMIAEWRVPAGLSTSVYSARIPADATAAKFFCRAPSGDGFDVQIVQREIGGSTSNTFSSAVTCDDTPAEVTSFADGSLTEGHWLELNISNVTGSPADEDELYVYLQANAPGGTVADDAIDTDKLDDGSDTPVENYLVAVDASADGFQYIQVGTGLAVSGSEYARTLAIAATTVDTTSSQTLEAKTLTDPSLGDDSGWTRRVQNDGSIGTTVNRLAKIQEDGSNAEEAVIAGTSDTGIPVWVVSSGAGTTGNAELMVSGEVQADADGACDVGDNVIASTSTGGEVTCESDPIAQDVFCVGVATQKIASAGLVDVAIGDLCTRVGEGAGETRSFSWAITDPATSDSEAVQWLAARAVTITSLDCSTDTGTADIQLDERVLTTPNTGGTDVMSSALQCDNNNAQQTSFSNAGIAAGALVNLDIDAVASNPTQLRIHVTYTVN